MRRVVQVVERVEETPSTVTLRYADATAARPGQFVMVWVPGDDELPMSLAYVGDRKGITVKSMGATSHRIQSIPVGTLLGIRGPYGNAFDPTPARILVVGGGSGSAVLAPAAESAARAGADIVAALGATTERELLFADRFRALGAVVHVATDDGSAGAPGYVTGVVDGLLAHQEFDAVWTCGPEVMMRKVIAAARPRATPVFCSVERWMKCGVGLCDACALGPWHVCVDGPVFPGEVLSRASGFSEYFRDA
ncbi:MAG TPA: dihydroorotate dehydrogenase electron transfer subunit, partial [Thermoplasmata archaeon]